ncbi:AUGMIN subunit 8-like isoform X2 [Aristolochia californica]|uniref:AUGMIN subunit 8-like isoform X2 n=1 Tax=Aristolochia californica TaxID=171875 RepID=UPI0035E14474
MDVCGTEELPRSPLGLSEKNNVAISRKPRAKEIPSRYMSGLTSTSISTPRRCPSPTATRGSTSPGPSVSKRAQSTERRRPSTPSSPSVSSTPSSPSRPLTPSYPSRPTTPIKDLAAEMQISSRRSITGRTPEGLWPSMRSLSVSFQSDTFSLPVAKKERPVSDHTLRPSANVAHRQAESPARKATPERKRTPLRGKNASDQTENSKPIENSHMKLVDQHRWPSRVTGKVGAGALTRSVDLTDRASRSALSVSTRGVSPVRRPVASDTRNIQKSSREVSRRISLEGSGRMEYENCSIGDLFTRTCGPRKFLSLGSSELSTSTIRATRTQSLQLPVIRHPPSPTKLSLTAPTISRGSLSPCRSRPTSPFTSANSTVGRSISSASVLSFTADVVKGKKGSNHIEDAHQLRLLYNRYLQWRFVNARGDTTLTIQRLMAEDLLYNVWNATSELRDSVTMKRITLQQLRQDMKLDSLLREQMTYLDDWAVMDREHSISLAGATEALEACTLRLPVTDGARADAQMVKDSISSAVDVMQAMGSSICHLLSRVEEINSLVSELANVAAQERAMLDECGDLLASTAAMQVEESSLRTHLIQLKASYT